MDLIFIWSNCATKNVDVTMIAPKAPGHTVRSEYQAGKGTPCLVAVEQDATGRALDMALGLWFRLLVGQEQVFWKQHSELKLKLTYLVNRLYMWWCLCVNAGWFETLVEAGYDPKNAYFECIHEMN